MLLSPCSYNTTCTRSFRSTISLSASRRDMHEENLFCMITPLLASLAPNNHMILLPSRQEAPPTNALNLSFFDISCLEEEKENKVYLFSSVVMHHLNNEFVLFM